MEEMQEFFLGHGENGVLHAELFHLLDGVLQSGVDFKWQPSVKANPAPAPETVTFPNMPNEGISYDGVVDEFKRIAAGSANWGSPNFMGFPDTGNNLVSLLCV
jgi:hypothetical protein